MSNTRRIRLIGRRPAGARITWLDLAVIALCIVGTVVAQTRITGAMVYLPCIVLGHFFLFCNVFRVHRRLEIAWAAVFIVNTFAWFCLTLEGSASPVAFWSRVLLVQTPFTTTAVLIALFSKDYHGIGYRFIPWGRRIDSRRTLQEDSQCSEQ